MRFLSEEVEEGFAFNAEAEGETGFVGKDRVGPLAHGGDLVGGASVNFLEAVAGEVAGAGVAAE